MRASGAIRLLILGLGLAVMAGCDRQSTIPVSASEAPPDGAGLPFDRAAQRDGISPSSSVIPPGAQIPAGTPITVRLETSVSSATAKVDDSFVAVLDEPIMVNEQVIAERGTAVVGRVVDVKPMTKMRFPGYLRLRLSAILIDGKKTPLRSSSAFLKGTAPRRKPPSVQTAGDNTLLGTVATKGPVLGDAMVTDSGPPISFVTLPRDVTVGPDRRLTFRLLEPLPLVP